MIQRKALLNAHALFDIKCAALSRRPFDVLQSPLKIHVIRAIARKALARKTGARGLRSIMEQALIDTMFDLPNTPDVAKVVIEEAVITGNQPPLRVPREAAKSAA